MPYHSPPFSPGRERHRLPRGKSYKLLIGEVAERSKALDWNSSNIFTGVRGFESHPLRQTFSTLARAARGDGCGDSRTLREHEQAHHHEGGDDRRDSIKHAESK
jgi:hypothetical protein